MKICFDIWEMNVSSWRKFAKFVKKAIKGEVWEIFGDGEQTRDFIFIDDLIDAIMKTLKLKPGGEIFQIASNKEYSINEIVRIMRRMFRRKYGIETSIERVEARRGDVRRNYSDTTKALTLLNWKPNELFEHGVEKTIEYFLSAMGGTVLLNR